MGELNNTTEYVVKQQAEGKYRTKRTLMLLAYIAFAIGYFAFFTVGPVKVYPLVAFLPLFLWIIVFFTWRYVSIEHEYKMESGNMIFSDIYGGKSHKQIASYKIKDMEKIAPYTDEYKADYAASDVVSTKDFRGSTKSPDSYFFVTKDETGKKTVVLFEATEKALGVMRYYNSASTVVSKVRY